MDTAQSRANMAKGREAEKQVAEYLTARGFTCERRRQEGINDRGDIAGIPGVVIEVKAHKAIHLSQFVDEANVEAGNDSPFAVGVAWIKRRGTTDPANWYVAMDGATFMKFLNNYTP